MESCPNCGAPHDSPCPRGAQVRQHGNVILQGRYELLDLLGQGGMGTVYMARDLHLHSRPCVVKKLRDDFYREEDKQKAVAFFEREAGVLSKLQHPSIVHILDYFEENYDYFLVMDYVEGKDLHAILLERGQPFAESKVLSWSLQICDVLGYMHDHDPPVIYRDLKPSNIMLDVKDRVKLVDFGIARPVEEGQDNTHVVSAGFSPPEQYWGAADGRSDIYALGTTMFFLLTGQEPVALHPSAPRSAVTSISERTDLVVQRATSQDPSARYQSVDEMRQALLECSLPDRAGLLGQLGSHNKVVMAAALLALASAGILSYAFFDQALDWHGKQLKESERAKTKATREQAELKKRLSAYSRAVEANDQAIKEWSRMAKTSRQAKNEAQATDMAAQANGESDLTDPEGLLTQSSQHW